MKAKQGARRRSSRKIDSKELTVHRGNVDVYILEKVYEQVIGSADPNAYSLRNGNKIKWDVDIIDTLLRAVDWRKDWNEYSSCDGTAPEYVDKTFIKLMIAKHLLNLEVHLSWRGEQAPVPTEEELAMKEEQIVKNFVAYKHNVHIFVSTELMLSMLAKNSSTEARVANNNIIWSMDVIEPELKSVPESLIRTSLQSYYGGKTSETVDTTFLKLMIAGTKLHMPVGFGPSPEFKVGQVSKAPEPLKRRSIHQESAGPSKRPNTGEVGAYRTTILKVEPSHRNSPLEEQNKLIPSILRGGDKTKLNYFGTDFNLVSGISADDVSSDFQNVRNMLNALSPLLPETNPVQHPLYMFQGRMNVALDLIEAKCRGIAVSNEHLASQMAVPPSPEILNPKLEQIQVNVLQAIQKLHAALSYKDDRSNNTVALLQEIDRLKRLNEKMAKAFENERFKIVELEYALNRQTQKWADYANMGRVNQMAEAGFLINNKYDPPAATVEACNLIVMNKPNIYWSEFDQDRWCDLTHEQKKGMMLGWDPTDGKPYPAWATYDRACSICGTPIGPEGGYNAGTCVYCIYHPGCLQEFLLSGTRLECASCGIRFNPRLWSAFRLQNQFISLLPGMGPDGKELPKRQADMTTSEFTTWLEKDQAFIAAHTYILNKLILKRFELNDVDFRTLLHTRLPEYLQRRAREWGLRSEWISDVTENIRAICIPDVAGVGIPPFPHMVVESGVLQHPGYPSSFWRPSTGLPVHLAADALGRTAAPAGGGRPGQSSAHPQEN